ncbi:hypothetical protein Tco_1041235 [Tanacetum coccineum]|uniref:Uncharacterized protein n=1 Tax=Tanacetum coccineum TaxID=301880 RepID=A0ABQ5GFJ2_9ASTR
MRNGHVEVYGYAFWVNQCTSGFHGVNEPDDRGVTEGREDVREVFQQRGSGAKRKLSKCGRTQMGNEPILALLDGADDFVVYYDARSKDLEACLEKGRRNNNKTMVITKKGLRQANCPKRKLVGSNGKSIAVTVDKLWRVRKVSPWRGVFHLERKYKLEPGYVGPFDDPWMDVVLSIG